MKKIKKFSEEEDNIILKNVELYPTNLQESFRHSARELKRSVAVINVRYYNNLRKEQHVISTGSKHGFSRNVKNQPRFTSEQEIIPDLQFHEVVIKNLLSLPREKRQQIIQMFS